MNFVGPVERFCFVQIVAVCLSNSNPLTPFAEAIFPSAGPPFGNPLGASSDCGSVIISPYF